MSQSVVLSVFLDSHVCMSAPTWCIICLLDKAPFHYVILGCLRQKLTVREKRGKIFRHQSIMVIRGRTVSHMHQQPMWSFGDQRQILTM